MATAAGGMPAAWAGAWGVLALLSVLIAIPALVPLEGWMGVAHGVVLALAGLSAWAGMTRIAVAGDVDRARRLGLGAGGLQFGRGEVRVAAGLILNLLFLTVIAGVLALAAVAVLGLAQVDLPTLRIAAEPVWKTAAVAIVGAVALAALALLVVRLSLFAPASVGRGRVVSLNSMGVAHDAFWPLLMLWLIVAGTAAALPLAEARGWIAWPLSRLIAAAVLPWLWGPFAATLLAAAYRQLEYWTDGAAELR